jgi:hypothetical protein
MASPSNPIVVPAVMQEYLFYLPMSERPSHTLNRRLRGPLSVSYTSSTTGHQLRPNKSGYSSVPSSGTRLGNQIPYTKNSPTIPG